MTKPRKVSAPEKADNWKKALIISQIAGGIAAVGALCVGLVMLGMAL